MPDARATDVLVINPHLHRDAKCKSRSDFTSRLENVAALRTVAYHFALHLYPENSRQWNRTEGLHAIVSGGDFSRFDAPFYDEYKYFGMVIPSPTFKWVNNTTVGLLQK